MEDVKDIEIKLINISKKFEKNEILKNINLDLNNESFTAILGKSGSGKTTLLNIISLIDTYTTGKYIFNGSKILKNKDYAEYRRNYISIIFQSYNLISNMTVEENIKLPFIYSKENVEKRNFDELTKYLDIRSLLDKPVYVLSGGEKQRVAIARSIITNPSLIIADEPTGNLDEDDKWKVFEILKREKEKGRGILVVTHDKELASECNEIYYLKKGKLNRDD